MALYKFEYTVQKSGAAIIQLVCYGESLERVQHSLL